MKGSISSSLAVVPVVLAGCCSTSAPDGCCTGATAAPMSSSIGVQPATKPVEVSFLYLDLSVCEPCQGTQRGLSEALDAARALGLDVKLERVHVDSAELARRLGFQSSPTIRVNGRNIAPVREGVCGSCSDLCGTSTSCRVWSWRGRDYSGAPKELVLDAILRAAYGGATATGPESLAHELPENLVRFFEHRAKTAKPTASAESPCCDKKTCCT